MNFAGSFLGLGIILELFQISKINQGHLAYTLDDAEIHLILAEKILQGHYGINPGELASPSSSILWTRIYSPDEPAGTGMKSTYRGSSHGQRST